MGCFYSVPSPVYLILTFRRYCTLCCHEPWGQGYVPVVPDGLRELIPSASPFLDNFLGIRYFPISLHVMLSYFQYRALHFNSF